MAAGRRSGFGQTDLGREERSNDEAIGEMSARISQLKGITIGISEEVEQHNRLLDGISSGVDARLGTLAGVMGTFEKVYADKANRKLFWSCIGLMILVALLYKLFH